MDYKFLIPKIKHFTPTTLSMKFLLPAASILYLTLKTGAVPYGQEALVVNSEFYGKGEYQGLVGRRLLTLSEE
jgi:hypothetical protein